jgi:flagellar motor switch protein FliN/FliY
MAENSQEAQVPLFTEAFRQALSDALAKTIASTWKVEASQDVPATDVLSLHFAISPSGSLQGHAAFQLRQSDAVFLAQKILAEPSDVSAEMSEQRKQAVEKFLGQVAELAAAGLKTHFGDVTFQLSVTDPPDWSGVAVALAASESSAANCSIQLRLGSDMLAAVPIAKPDAPVAAQPEPVPTPGSNSADATESNLDLLMGIDLSLTLRFGQRSMTLREILDLSSGSVIELDRRVQEPADLLLGDKLIARGEVVIVDGNYGLRITEVSDPQHSAARGFLNSVTR